MNIETKKDTLLIVDDNPDNISVLFNYLKRTGFKILIAQNGERGIEKAEYGQPGLILLDIMMPKMDGFEACRILKSKKNTKDIPIIFMTARTDSIDKVKGFKLGAADYIIKPFQHEEVLARVNAHLNLYKLQQQLKIRNIQLDAFARTVAHDLKSPLNTVIGYADELVEICTEGGLLDDELMLQLKSVAKAGHKMESIINALLLLAKTRKSEEKVEMQPLDMSHIIAQAQERLIYTIKGCLAEINFPTTFPIAKGYAPWVEEVWANYISNGLKYGGYPPHLELGAETQDDDMICFWVRDNGQGLSKEAQDKLFTPFTRLHQERADGHGLGLSIVQQIVERLGGEVGIESEIGQGSTFYFTLPAK
ncbi:hybrid sensor histidine kinase/response regulator [Candidatus Parabeggiatoa sp. HSG14]|uniref:hybrid sensor histidine kinase/response regulator n=1 Tax=Candidatus Parabeggiatoa sp. HSG14 TaxID=3055593 RepID=UPI0025A82C2E|nr:hybrid sensor histidine kinase/response regulator [Thiotrichales bacterium HSG14]